jgi:hypothetical protein
MFPALARRFSQGFEKGEKTVKNFPRRRAFKEEFQNVPFKFQPAPLHRGAPALMGAHVAALTTALAAATAPGRARFCWHHFFSWS